MGSNQVRKWRQLSRRQRRLGQAVLVGLSVAVLLSGIHWLGLFYSRQVASADYLYETDGDPGDEVVIVAIDERSVEALGEWPWSLDRYARLFERLGGAGAVGFDVLLTTSGPEGNPETAALLQAARAAGNVIVPLAALELLPPDMPGNLYGIGRTIPTFPALEEAAAGVGAVSVVLDRDGTVRRIPLLVQVGEDTVIETFALRILRQQLGLSDDPAVLQKGGVVIGSTDEIRYQVATDTHGVMLVNYVGRPNTFPVYSFVDVIEGRVDERVFDDRIVLVGMMNTLSEMDLHRTPVSATRMSGIEFTANVIHTLYHHRALTAAGYTETTVTVILLALASALVLAQVGVLWGTLFTAGLLLLYLVYTTMRFSAGVVPSTFSPFLSIVVTFGAIMTLRFASEQAERGRVTDVFGRFVSTQVRNAIVNLALQDPNLIQPGGRQIEISVMFADIRGFTAIAENLEPSAVVELLNLYLHSMEEEVFKEAGTLDKYTGDGMMVIFGAPLQQPDHAARAVRTALNMQRAAAEVSRARGESEFKIEYGIGITTGPAVVGQIGSPRRLDYTAIGDTVNLAARLEGQAPPGVVLIDRATYLAVQDWIVATELAPVSVKGKARPVPVWSVVALKDADITA